jgi:glycosyltransferase involved in cell wall biosynthesis
MGATVFTDVSVVIPTRNARGWVGRAIESARAQSRAPAEIIVVDDGSPDGTLELVRGQYPDVIAERSPHKGVSAARNCGIAMARGECVAFLDADDVWAPWKLERQHAAVAAHPGWGMCVADGRRFRPGDAVDWGVRPETPRRPPHLLAFADLLRCHGVFTSSVLVRRSVLDEVGTFDEGLVRSEDHDLWLRIAHAHPLVELSDVLIAYQVTPGSLSHEPLALGVDRLRVIDRWRETAPEAVAQAVRLRASSLVRKLLRAGRTDEARTIYGDWLCRDGRMSGPDRAAFAALRAYCRAQRLLRSA